MDSPLKQKEPAARATTALGAAQIVAKLAHIDGWKLHGDGADVAIEKTYRFDSYLETMAFANAVAYIAERQDHHPDLLVQFKACSVRWHTHDVQGISLNDFKCAALVDALIQPD